MVSGTMGLCWGEVPTVDQVTIFHVNRNSKQLHGTYCVPGIFVVSPAGLSFPVQK